MNLIFIGPPGSGKGTQAKIISKKLSLVHISTGDLLRNVEGDLRLKINSYMDSGGLVPDEIILEVLKEKLDNFESKNGFILDGFPRNLSQAKQLNRIVHIDKVIEVYISDKEAIKRISSRISCKNCGSVYNLITNSPRKKGICDVCLKKLVSRVDDNEDSIKERLKIYHSETEPILEIYDFVRINGEQSVELVTEEILSVLI